LGYIEGEENPLEKWLGEFLERREAIVRKLNPKSEEEIVRYFTYSNMKTNEKDFCPLYSKNQKCHSLSESELNCYLCACPFYDPSLWDAENKQYGNCIIGSKSGFRNEFGYWDCSNCILPHTKKFVLQYLKKHLR
jgi:Zn-finger protein